MAKRPGKTRASDAWGTESTPERTERVQFKVSTDEIAAIDEFRFQTLPLQASTKLRADINQAFSKTHIESRTNDYSARTTNITVMLTPAAAQRYVSSVCRR
jgi:hypothetical protein